MKKKNPSCAKNPVCIIFSTCSMSFIIARNKMTNPRRNTNASIRFWFKEAKITYSPYIEVMMVIISYMLRVCEKNLAGVKITIPVKAIASNSSRRRNRTENFRKIDRINIPKTGMARYHERYSNLIISSQFTSGKERMRYLPPVVSDLSTIRKQKMLK